MDSRSSRLLSGRRVPSRHSARFISRSALAMAIDALPMMLPTVDRTAPGCRGKSRGSTPGRAWTPSDRVRSDRDHTTYDLRRKTCVRPATAGTSDPDEVADEDQRLAGGDTATGAALAVREV